MKPNSLYCHCIWRNSRHKYLKLNIKGQIDTDERSQTLGFFLLIHSLWFVTAVCSRAVLSCKLLAQSKRDNTVNCLWMSLWPRMFSRVYPRVAETDNKEWQVLWDRNSKDDHLHIQAFISFKVDILWDDETKVVMSGNVDSLMMMDSFDTQESLWCLHENCSDIAARLLFFPV